jgi:hypothetical protein
VCQLVGEDAPFRFKDRKRTQRVPLRVSAAPSKEAEEEEEEEGSVMPCQRHGASGVIPLKLIACVKSVSHRTTSSPCVSQGLSGGDGCRHDMHGDDMHWKRKKGLVSLA